MSLIKIAELIKPLDKNLFEIITTKFYLDDLVAALNTPQEAVELIPKLNNLLKIFGLETHKWQSNNPEVMKSIPIEKRGTEKTFIIKETSELSDMSDTNSEDNMSNNPTRHSVPMIGKSLGMHWSLEENDSYITFEHLNAIAEKIKGTNTLTKRSISAFCGYFFNPLGELSLISITIKVCLKLSWEISIKNWDLDLSKPLDNNLYSNESELKRQKIVKYHDLFIKNLENCSTWKIPRYIFGKNSILPAICKKDIILATDSGKYAKCFNLYGRALLQDGTIITGLICSKTKLNPKRGRTSPETTNMPEYELDALNDGVNLLEKVMKILDINEYQIVLDASVVIHQLKKASKEGCGIFKRFVHNRLKNILSKISSEKVYHIPTNLNPSDLGSKPLLVKDQQQLWFFGPTLFQQSWDLSKILSDTPPVPQSDINECLPGISKRCLLNISSYQNDGMLNDILYKYSKLEKLLRVTFFVKSFIFKISKRLRKRRNFANLLFMDLYSEENRATTRGCTDKQLAYQNTIMKKYNCENRAAALNFWIRVSQKDQFREEFEILEKGQTIPKSSKLRSTHSFKSLQICYG